MGTGRPPDRKQGIFETLLVLAGHPVELEAHMDRIGASLTSAFAAELPTGARDLVRERAKGLSLGRLRLTVTPVAHGLDYGVVTAAVDPETFFPEEGADLRSVQLSGGLGRDKWADRSALPSGADGAIPLLLDGEEVLEAGWANIFIVDSGKLVTPAADERILPGIARAATVEIAREAGIEVEERRLDRDELIGAEAVFLTGSVRGIGPARSLDGIPLGTGSRLIRQLADGLKRRWWGQVEPSASADSLRQLLDRAQSGQDAVGPLGEVAQ